MSDSNWNSMLPAMVDSAMADSVEADPLDRLLAATLRKRAEAQPIANLAQRAMESAARLDREVAQQRRTLTIHRWRLRFIYTAAAMLIGVLIVLGGQRLLIERQSMASGDDSSSTSTSSETSSSTLSTSTYMLWLGGLLFVCAVAGAAAESSFAADRPSMLV